MRILHIIRYSRRRAAGDKMEQKFWIECGGRYQSVYGMVHVDYEVATKPIGLAKLTVCSAYPVGSSL